MSIYISCHPVDDLFAVELLAYIRTLGFSADILPTNFVEVITKSDMLVTILRSDYVQSLAYNKLLSGLSDHTIIIPVLRSPIDISDWNGNAILSPVVDFTNYAEEQITSGLRSLGNILTSHTDHLSNRYPNPLTNYLNKLEATILGKYFPFHLLEAANYGHNDIHETPIYALLAQNQFEVFSINQPVSNPVYRIDTLSNIAKSQEPCLIECDEFDSGFVAMFLADVGRQLLACTTDRSIPLLLDVVEWNKNISSAEWLKHQIDLSQITPDILQNINFTLFVYGFEHSNQDLNQFQEEFARWWITTSATLSLVIVNPSLMSSQDTIVENRIKPNKWDKDRLLQFCTQYSDRSFAQYVISAIGKNQQASCIQYLAKKPIFAAILLSLRFKNEVEVLNLDLVDCFEYLVSNFWKLLNHDENDDLLVTNSIAQIAAILTEHQKAFIDYDDAIAYIQLEPLLHRCIDTGLFALKDNKIRFSLSILQDYFAAIALVKYGVPSHLPTLILNEQSARVPQRWDNPFIIASHLTSTPDELLKQVANSDPLLALECLLRSDPHNASLYSYLVERNLGALVSVGDFRTDFAKLLYTIDPMKAKAILLEILRNGYWGVRLYAYQVLQELNFPLNLGVIESLENLHESSQTNVSQALKRIATDALPTLFQLLHHDNANLKLNALWAISELEDKACVPAVVNLLHENNITIAVHAVAVLDKLQDVCVLPCLVKYLQHRHPNMRKAIKETISRMQNLYPDQFIRVVHQMDTTMRQQIVVYLSTTKLNTTNVDFLLHFSRDENIDIRIAALEGLASSSEPRVIARFEECLEDMSKSRLNKTSVSEIVSRILSNIPHKDDSISVAPNTQISTRPLNSSQIVKARLLHAKTQQPDNSELPSIDDVEETEFLLEKETKPEPEDAYVSDILAQLRTRKWDTSNNAAKMLRDYVKSLRSKTSLRVVNQILETLNDDDWMIRWTGVETLGWVGNIHVVPHLIQRLSDSNWKVRVAAIRALAEIKDNSAVAGLSTLNADENAVVREAAAEALGFLGGRQAVHALETFALDAEDFVRLSAVESLGRLCDKQALSALLTTLKDSSEHVRWAAANGLLGIAESISVSMLLPSLSDTSGPYWEQKRICDVIVDILKKINTEEAKKALAEWQTSQV